MSSSVQSLGFLGSTFFTPNDTRWDDIPAIERIFSLTILSCVKPKANNLDFWGATVFFGLVTFFGLSKVRTFPFKGVEEGTGHLSWFLFLSALALRRSIIVGGSCIIVGGSCGNGSGGDGRD